MGQQEDKINEERKYYLDIISSAHERTVKWMARIIVLLILLLVAGVIAFVIREDKYAIETTEIEATSDDGGTVMANMMGVMTNYGDDSQNQNNKEG